MRRLRISPLGYSQRQGAQVTTPQRLAPRAFGTEASKNRYVLDVAPLVAGAIYRLVRLNRLSHPRR